ncbi:MFS transporter [Streptomyces sp. JJ36]|uniref:MFS transporter n=1 Tax=Streptomyces sp. JJ36 TaxID=2736645 RepID=UPI001F01E637|nr:MFS transporter [Streptomyces sp. JJ36]
MSVYLDRNFLLSYAASFISLFGSKLLMISYVAYVYGETGSATLASAVFAADWVANLFVGLLAASFIDRADARRLLLVLNVTAAAVTTAFLACLTPERFPLAVAVIFLRALLNSAVNTARVKGLVQFFDEEGTDTFSAVFNSSLFIAVAAAGAVGTVLLRFTGMVTVVLIDVATFLLATALFALVRPHRERTARARRAARRDARGPLAGVAGAVRLVRGDPVLGTAFFYIVLSVTAFQATYEVLISAMPELWFGLGEPGTALFFTAESVAVTAGVFAYQYLGRRGLVPEHRQRRLNLGTAVAATLLYAAVPLAQDSLTLTLLAFVAVVFGGELIWAHQYKRLIARTPDARISSVVGLLSAVGYSLMAVLGFAFSRAMDALGAEWAIALDLVLIALLVACWELGARRPSRQGSSREDLGIPSPAAPSARVRPARSGRPRDAGGEGGEGPRPDGGRGEPEPAAAHGAVPGP